MLSNNQSLLGIIVVKTPLSFSLVYANRQYLLKHRMTCHAQVLAFSAYCTAKYRTMRMLFQPQHATRLRENALRRAAIPARFCLAPRVINLHL